MMRYINQLIKKRVSDLGLWVWERGNDVMKALRTVLLIIIIGTAIIFALNLIVEHRNEGFALILPVFLALTVPIICGGLLLFAWNLTERSREDRKRFNANCVAWLVGFAFLLATILLVRDFSLSSFSLSSQKASVGEILWTILFAVIGFMFLWQVHLLLKKVSLSIFIFMLVAGSSVVLYSYYCIPLDNWLVGLSLIGVVAGGGIYAMIKPEVLSLMRGEVDGGTNQK